jgi:hypothetical protein
MNGILYRFARDEKTLFKDLLLNKDYATMFAMVFNYLNLIVNTVAP